MESHEDKKQTIFKNGGGEDLNMEKTSGGLDQNLAGLLAYLAGVISGVIFLVIEKENKFVRFHAFQSIMVTIAIMIVSMGLSLIPVFGWVISLFISPLAFILWLVLMFKAYKGEVFKLPILGDMAASQAGLD